MRTCSTTPMSASTSKDKIAYTSSKETAITITITIAIVTIAITAVTHSEKYWKIPRDPYR